MFAKTLLITLLASTALAQPSSGSGPSCGGPCPGTAGFNPLAAGEAA